MYTQLEKLNWQGKIVRPFVTHEGSGLGNVPHELRALCRGATIENGLAIRGTGCVRHRTRLQLGFNYRVDARCGVTRSGKKFVCFFFLCIL